MNSSCVVFAVLLSAVSMDILFTSLLPTPSLPLPCRYQLSDWSGAMYAQLAQEYVREPASTKSLSTRQAQLIDDDWCPTKVGSRS